MRRRPSAKPTVYIDTNIVSAMFGRPSFVVDVHHQMATREWWENERRHFRVYGSSILEGELSNGKYVGQVHALAVVRRLPYLPITGTLHRAARVLIDERVVPVQKPGDALQLACATVHSIDYLLTWNHAHLMNADTQRRLTPFVGGRSGDHPPWSLRKPFPRQPSDRRYGDLTMTNDPDRPQIDDVERCRQVRRNLEIKHGGLDGLFAHFAKLELKKRKRRVTKVRAIGRKRVTQKNS